MGWVHVDATDFAPQPEPTSRHFKGIAMFKRCSALIVTMLWLATAIPALAADPGTGTTTVRPKVSITANSLTQFKSIVGKVVLSEDACGTNLPSCTVDIVKPSPTAKVREADLFCATTGFTGYNPQDDDVTLNGFAVLWDATIPNGISSFNSRDDVTAIVKPVGDAALPGVVTFSITEDPTFDYDGCALKVIWDDPTTTDNSVLIYWGAQETTGDTFVINFAPLTASSLAAPLEFSLGISYSHQPGGQFSQVDVNGMRLTTSAGGEDDGEAANGALITLGGTGDTPVNPPPNDPPTTPSVPDDELYDLVPFVNVGDTSMTIFTLNPSNDDNIFLANLFLRNVTVVPPPPTGPAHLTLAPKTATNPVGTQHCVTATVTDENGAPVPLVPVNFSVSGANTAAGASVTDANGEAQFCYVGTMLGNDTITARAVGGTNPSDTAAKTWTHGPPATLTLSPKTATNPVDTQHCVTATVKDAFGNPVPGVTVNFNVEGASEIDTSPTDEDGEVTTDANGVARFCYTGPDLPGADTIHAFADTNDNNVQDAGEPSDDATKTWVLPVSTPLCEVKITNGGWIITANGDRANFGGNAKADGAGNASGNEEYQDKGPLTPLNAHGNVLAVICVSATEATIYGKTTVDGSGDYFYRIRVQDNGEGGMALARDKYGILIGNSAPPYYSGEQDLKGGNVQIHNG
jgi:protocatechuate 3,4-dioxygenase beta subunit